MSMTVYVKGKSKKQINEDLLIGAKFNAVEYGMTGNTTHKLDSNLPTGTTIKVFEKYIGGSPYAKAYGTWNAEKSKIV